ncbi:MAG: dihydroorotate dehydrogenase electron transfer subunit [Tidjanibacter sp.]|nr:dihydroorotate dehydrogenase electron transfer subunit [Tidjanibacter sp.]
MYKRDIYKVVSNEQLTAKSWLMVLEGDTQYVTRAGEFVNIALEGKFLRRPISVCDYDERTITLLYDVVGEGTKAMSLMKEGAELDLLTGLGNGFSEERECRRPALLGGGVGCAPLYNLAKKFLARGVKPVVILGFNSEKDVVSADMFEAIGAELYIATVDGSMGTKGFVTDVIREQGLECDYFYACGPMPMLKALCRGVEWPGEVSLDERMACGFGVCMCCSVETKSGNKRICKEGPVFDKEDLIWK